MIKTEFHSYPDIENAYRTAFVERQFLNGLGDIQWCVLEKIHGANSQLKYDGEQDGFRYGKRTCFIADGDNFYHLPELMEPLYTKLEKAYKMLKDTVLPTIKNITIYGEVFGGSYPVQGVEVDRAAKQVQREVKYHPSNKWKAFDIAVEYDENGEHVRKFLGGKQFFDICNLFNIETVPLLKVADNLKEALEFPNDLPSVVYKEYGLPEIEGNIMEGVVLRPWLGDYFFGFERSIIKNKNEKFKEKHRTPKEYKEATPLSEMTRKCIEEVSCLINEQRLHSVMSKIGDNLTARDIGRVMKEFNADVIKEYMKDEESSYCFIKDDEKEWKRVTKAISTMSAEIIKKELLYK